MNGYLNIIDLLKYKSVLVLDMGLHKRLIFSIPYTFDALRINPCLHFSSSTLAYLRKDKFSLTKVQFPFSRHSFNYSFLSQMKEKSKLNENDKPNELKLSEISKDCTNKQELVLRSKLETKIATKCQIKIEEWNEILNSILEITGIINEKNIKATILNLCSDLQSLTLGKSFFKYLRSTEKQINLVTYGNYLKLFYNCSNHCTDDDLNEIYTIYKELLQYYPQIDSYTAEKAVCALSITKYWKEYEKLFKHIKMLYNPTPHAYSVVIKAAIRNRDLELGWTLMEEMQLNGQNIPDNVYLFWLELVKTGRSNILINLLEFMKKFNIKPSKNISEELKDNFEKISGSRNAKLTGIFRSGICKNCHAKLEPATVNLEDYDQLKTAFLNPVLIGNDIFQKTKPEEFSEFLKFLEKTAPYNIVLDGLNIALHIHKSRKSPSTSAFQLKSVVEHFVTHNKKVLVLGRKHMKNWHSRDMEYVYNNADLFLADNISKDDPFLLYAALYSGLGTCFVSKDLMRGHKFLLSDPKLQTTFVKWQAQHQYFITHIDDSGGVRLIEPVSFMQSTQVNSKGDWHIPYIVKESLTNETRPDNYHKYWLCLTSKLQHPQPPSSGHKIQKQRSKPKVVLKTLFSS